MCSGLCALVRDVFVRKTTPVCYVYICFSGGVLAHIEMHSTELPSSLNSIASRSLNSARLIQSIVMVATHTQAHMVGCLEVGQYTSAQKRIIYPDCRLANLSAHRQSMALYASNWWRLSGGGDVGLLLAPSCRTRHSSHTYTCRPQFDVVQMSTEAIVYTSIYKDCGGYCYLCEKKKKPLCVFTPRTSVRNQ